LYFDRSTCSSEGGHVATSPVPIAAETLALLQLDAWNGLDDDSRLALSEHIARRLEAHGWGVDEPLALRRFGPAGSEQAVLQWRDPGTGLPFSLIPGGTFRPGLDEDLMAHYDQLRRQLGPHGEEAASEVDEPPGHALPMGSARACDLRRRAPVTVAPLLMAAELAPASIPEIRDLLDIPGIESMCQQFEVRGYNAEVGWDGVDAVLERLGWSLPTSSEFEWALRGGVDSLFYWGDEPPEFMTTEWSEATSASCEASFDQVMSTRFDPDRPRSWPWCNRFGLAAMVAQGTWCASSRDPNDAAPLVVRGGAADYYPWQNCGEWLLLMNAVESYQGSRWNVNFIACFRPVIRLGAG
jgi:hypothetical protein